MKNKEVFVVIDRKCPELCKSIKYYKDIFGSCHKEKFEKNIKDHPDFEKKLLLENIAFHHALFELAVEMASSLYAEKTNCKSNIADLLNKKYSAGMIDIFGNR